jgi:transposase
MLRRAAGRKEEPTAAIIDSRTLRSTPESGTRAGYDGAKRKRGSKIHMAVDTLGHLLALHVTPADVGDRQAVARLAADIQDATGDSVKLAYVDQGYTGEATADAAAADCRVHRRRAGLHFQQTGHLLFEIADRVHLKA